MQSSQLQGESDCIKQHWWTLDICRSKKNRTYLKLILEFNTFSIYFDDHNKRKKNTNTEKAEVEFNEWFIFLPVLQCHSIELLFFLLLLQLQYIYSIDFSLLPVSFSQQISVQNNWQDDLIYSFHILLQLHVGSLL